MKSTFFFLFYAGKSIWKLFDPYGICAFCCLLAYFIPHPHPSHWRCPPHARNTPLPDHATSRELGNELHFHGCFDCLSLIRIDAKEHYSLFKSHAGSVSHFSPKGHSIKDTDLVQRKQVFANERCILGGLHKRLTGLALQATRGTA